MQHSMLLCILTSWTITREQKGLYIPNIKLEIVNVCGQAKMSVTFDYKNEFYRQILSSYESRVITPFQMMEETFNMMIDTLDKRLTNDTK